MLSMLDLGDSVSGWVTAPIVQSLGLTLGDYSRLPDLVWIGAGSRLATLALVPLLAARARGGGEPPRGDGATAGESGEATPLLAQA